VKLKQHGGELSESSVLITWEPAQYAAFALIAACWLIWLGVRIYVSRRLFRAIWPELREAGKLPKPNRKLRRIKILAFAIFHPWQTLARYENQADENEDRAAT
jgi:hypothetical protein